MGRLQLTTDRLLLRRWYESDRDPFAELNADPLVMEYFPTTLTRAQSDDFVTRIERHFEEHGMGLWAVEERSSGSFIGYVGLWPANFAAHFTPATEVGWRLARPFWGRGYATEAARQALNDGFGRIGLTEIVSFTSAVNTRSRRVMEKLGMSHDPADDFDHPSVAAGDRLRPHVLYRLTTGDTS